MDHSQPSRGNLGFATDAVTTGLYEKLRQGTSLLHIYKLVVSGFHVASGVCCFLWLSLSPPHWLSGAHTDDKHKLLWLSPPRWNRSDQEAGRKTPPLWSSTMVLLQPPDGLSEAIVGLPGWQAAGTWVSVSVKWWDSPPPSGSLEPANQYAPSKKQRERWKARGRLSWNKSLRSLYQWNCFANM